MNRFPLIGTIAVALPALAAPIEIDVLLAEGDPGPGTGANVTRIYKGSTNNAGQVIIGGRTSGAGRAVWAGDPASLALIAEQGQSSPAPGSPAFSNLTNYNGIFPIINDQGDSAFIGNANGVGIFTHVVGALQHIASHGDAVPGVPGTTFQMNFGNLEATAFSLGGISTFHSPIENGGVTGGDNDVVFGGPAGSIQLLAREGSLVTGETDISFQGVNAIFQGTHTSSNGTTAYCATLTGAGAAGPDDDAGIILGTPGAFTLALQSGSPASDPALPPDAVFLGLNSNHPVQVNNNGELLFISSLAGTGLTGNLTAGTGNYIALWTGTPGNYRIVARRGDPGPGLPAGVNFSIYESLNPATDAIALASNGDCAFVTSLTGSVTNSDDSAICAEIGGTLHPVAREGDAAPGLAAGILFSSFTPSESIAINANGIVLFHADLLGTGITTANNEALYFWSETGGLQLIAHEGSTIETSPGVFQTVGSLPLNGSMGDDSAHGRNLNNRNEAVFATELDGDEAFLRAKLVTPATYQLITSDTHSSAGGVLSSADYQSAATTGHPAGAQGSSANYLGKPGFVGQLYDPASLLVTASPDPVDEETTTQASATILMDDATELPLTNNAPAWEVMAGPFTGITATGLATAGVVYQNEPATLRASWGGLSGDGNVLISDTDPDNYQDYATDGIDDDWQVKYFGLPPNTAAAPGENPDGDPHNNLFEFLTGYLPTDPASFFRYRITDKTGDNVSFELSKVVPGTRYFLKRGTTLPPDHTWFEISNFTVPSDAVDYGVTDKNAADPNAFYEIEVVAE